MVWQSVGCFSIWMRNRIFWFRILFFCSIWGFENFFCSCSTNFGFSIIIIIAHINYCLNNYIRFEIAVGCWYSKSFYYILVGDKQWGKSKPNSFFVVDMRNLKYTWHHQCWKMYWTQPIAWIWAMDWTSNQCRCWAIKNLFYHLYVYVLYWLLLLETHIRSEIMFAVVCCAHEKINQRNFHFDNMDSTYGLPRYDDNPLQLLEL